MYPSSTLFDSWGDNYEITPKIEYIRGSITFGKLKAGDVIYYTRGDGDFIEITVKRELHNAKGKLYLTVNPFSLPHVHGRIYSIDFGPNHSSNEVENASVIYFQSGIISTDKKSLIRKWLIIKINERAKKQRELNELTAEINALEESLEK